MANVFGLARDFIKKHKVITGILVIILLAVGYYAYGAITAKKATTSYVTSPAALGTITTSVSGSGQVAASNSINLQFQASGTLTYLGVKNGQNVSAGQLIAQLDTTDAQKAVASAESSLQATQIALQKLEGPSTLAIPQNKQDAINNLQNAKDTLNQDYQTGYNTVSNVFIDLPAIMTDLQTALYGNTFNNSQQNIDFYTSAAGSYDPTAPTFKDSLTKSYQKALAEYTKNFDDYKLTSVGSNNDTIDSILNETYNTTRDIAQAIKDANNLIQFYENTIAVYGIKPNPLAVTQLATINSDSSKTNADTTSLLNIQNTIKNDKNAIETANTAVDNSDLDLQSQQLSLQNSQTALKNTKDALSNYYIYAPFAGTIGNVSVQKLAQVGSGTSVATLITTQKIATIPLNEIDVSNVTVGQQAVITFNALPNLSVAGTVASINPIGTVSSGVVTYNVQIAFSTQDERVKSGMSMSANIITNVKQNVILVPNSAVKTQGTTKYVQVLVNNVPQIKPVTVGLSNTTNTEITSGINVGDKAITQTINSATTSTTGTTSGSSVRIPGLGGGGFGGGRPGN